jgi:Do/DeqQ family serine protease
MKTFSKSLAGFVSAVAGVLIVAAVFHATLWGKDNGPAIKVESTPVNRDAKLGTSFAPVIKHAAASVVSIYTTRFVREQESPTFRRFLGDQVPDFRIPDDNNSDTPERTRKERGLGSGVIVSSDGYILTANHVVDGADEIKVSVTDNKKPFSAKVIGKDEATDVAILKIDSANLPAITLADSDQLEVGDVVLAIGNPFNVGQTVTMGVVSGLGRNGLGISRYEDFIQTDAAINPGNSGGALVDMGGRVIGINTAIYSRSGGSQGIGFAIPSNMVRVVVASARGGGTAVKRPWLGAKLQAVTPEIAESLGLKRPAGALVTSVTPESPAARGGLKTADLIVTIDGQIVDDPNAFDYRFATKPLGGTAQLGVMRAGKETKIAVALETAPEIPRDELVISARSPFLGAKVANLSPALADELRLEAAAEGVVILEVADGSPAETVGFQRGDIVAAVNNQRILKTRDLERATRESSRQWRVTIVRGGRQVSVVLGGL